ncbi:hypothetical protein [Massilia eurypsychrophila]|jgi:hypothetical protein|uniref:hypothetical protein n=1 Tax=Massilia eurypsychrophila TaxID=1485217 RepID=UPI0010347ED7|nr:hypothetical protein [Massilia eurypsychrophila]
MCATLQLATANQQKLIAATEVDACTTPQECKWMHQKQNKKMGSDPFDIRRFRQTPNSRVNDKRGPGRYLAEQKRAG